LETIETDAPDLLIEIKKEEPPADMDIEEAFTDSQGNQLLPINFPKSTKTSPAHSVASSKYQGNQGTLPWPNQSSRQSSIQSGSNNECPGGPGHNIIHEVNIAE
jgi:hypothetical protein